MDTLAAPLFVALTGSFFFIATLTLTAFLKISVVLMIVRNATGLQQVPSNAILMALALLLAIFIAMPALSRAAGALAEAGLELNSPSDVFRLWSLGLEPFDAFISRHTDETRLTMFQEAAAEIWRGEQMELGENDFAIRVPAFMVTELTEAFQIGLLIYLPFVAIDLAVTGILMAMGMQMVQPMILATPLKLLLFVFVDGWAKVIDGLLLTYAAVP